MKAVLFHIPKTAGSSLAHFYSSKFDGRIWQQTGSDDFSYLDQGVKEYSFISGHLGISEHIGNFDHDWLKVTVLRSPLTHIPSQYFHVQLESSHDTEKFKALMRQANEMSLKDMLDNLKDPEAVKLFDNPQTRFVLGCEGEALTKRHFDKAKHVLSKMDIVGIYERLPGVVHAINARLGLTNLQILPVLRAGHRPDFQLELSAPDTIQAILRRSRFDMALFQWALETFEAQQEATPTAVAAAKPLVKPIQLNALALSDRCEVNGAEKGTEFKVLNQFIYLHPNHEKDGGAIATLRDVKLSGHTRLKTRLRVTHAHGPNVYFRISVSKHNEPVSSMTVCVDAGRENEVNLVFPQAFGTHDIVLNTWVPDVVSINYGESIIIDPIIE